jgi:hypothetical protein
MEHKHNHGKHQRGTPNFKMPRSLASTPPPLVFDVALSETETTLLY